MKVDVAIIGAGTAALAARAAVKRAKKSFVMIDDGPLGTMCARVGCMPSKLLIQAAHVAETVRRAGEFGVRTTLQVDAPKVFERVRRERDHFVADAVADTGDVLAERARFVSPVALQAGEQRIEANAFVVAAGSRPTVPKEFAAVPFLTSDTIFELNEIPRTLAVIGAGPLALELGQAMQRLGSEVTFFSKDEGLARLSDPVVREAALASLGLKIHFNVKLDEAKKIGEAIEIYGQRFAAVLLAAGRKPALDDLDLPAAGVQSLDFHPHTMRLGDSRVFIAGDAANDRPLQHEAVDEGRIAGTNAANFPDLKKHPRYVPLSIVFTQPEIAMVGEKFSALKAPRFAEIDFSSQGRSRIMGEAKGKARIYAADDGTLLGAEMVAPEAEHLAHLLAVLIAKKSTARDLLTLPFYHPTLEESLRGAARKLLR